jgi:hypothetical protein
MKPYTKFRQWVHTLYLDNCREREAFGDKPCRDTQEYFNKYKWWLKREYRHQKNSEQV